MKIKKSNWDKKRVSCLIAEIELQQHNLSCNISELIMGEGFKGSRWDEIENKTLVKGIRAAGIWFLNLSSMRFTKKQRGEGLVEFFFPYDYCSDGPRHEKFFVPSELGKREEGFTPLYAVDKYWGNPLRSHKGIRRTDKGFLLEWNAPTGIEKSVSIWNNWKGKYLRGAECIFGEWKKTEGTCVWEAVTAFGWSYQLETFKSS